MSSTLAPIELLRWYLDAGVDEAVGEVALDRFALSRQPAPPPAAAHPAPRPRPPSPPARAPEETERTAIPGTSAHLAANCASLDALKAALEAFDEVALKRTALSTVFADGNPQAEVMLIGEAPGQEEDRRGVPFVGKSGKLLDRMLASIGLDRDNAYITNVVPWRPVDNRKPTPDEVAVCLPFLVRHIELVAPRVLVLLGGASASAVLGRHEGISRLRGRWYDYASPGLPAPIAALASFHPAYLLRTPEAKRGAWRDFLMVLKRLGELPQS
jgi:uracil-DNA glycosylase